MGRRTRYRAFAIVYGAGILAQLALFCVVLWWGITGTRTQAVMGLIIMPAQGILLLRSGGWWLHVAAKITGVETGGHR